MVKGKLTSTVIITALVVLCVYLGMNYMKARQGQEALASQIADASQLVVELPEVSQDLEERLEIAQARLDDEQGAFPSEINSIEVVDAILELANDCEVKVVPIETQPQATVTVGEHDYNIFRLKVVVEGSLDQLFAFIAGLEKGEFETLIIEHLEVDRGIEEAEEESAEDTIPVIASFDLAVYSWSPISE